MPSQIRYFHVRREWEDPTEDGGPRMSSQHITCYHCLYESFLSSFIDPAFALWPTIKQSAQQVVPEENVARHINRLVQEFLGCVANDCLLIHYANLIWCSATDTDNIQGRLDEIVNSVIHNTADILPSRVEFLESIRRILGWYVYTVVAIVCLPITLSFFSSCSIHNQWYLLCFWWNQNIFCLSNLHILLLLLPWCDV